MPESNWRYGVAVGLISLASLGQTQDNPEPALENQPVSPSGQSDDGNGTAGQSDEETSDPKDYSAFLTGIESAIRNLVAEEDQTERDRQQERESRDLTGSVAQIRPRPSFPFR